MSWLTPGGLAAALAVGAAVAWGLGWPGVSMLLAFFLSGSLLTQLAERSPPRRTSRQVLANGGVAAVAALLGSWTATAGALAAAAADTWATEIGSFSPVSPRLITTGARVTRGTSGSITALGTAGGVVGAAVIAALAAWLQPRGLAGLTNPAWLQPRGAAPGLTHPAWLEPRGVAPGLTHPTELLALTVAAGVLGMLVDSLLGATVQGRYECPACGAQFEWGSTVCHEPVRPIRGWRWLDNHGVNLAATLAGAAAAVLGSGF